MLAALLYCLSVIAEDKSNPYGIFIGDVEAKWLDENGDDRRMEMLHDFSYVDTTGKKWTTPKGWVVDGASIPRLLWTLVGSPFTGGYRRASVVHDYYCDTKTESWQAVHKMFYWASLAGGVGLAEAKILYAGVYAGGPRWKNVHYSNHPPRIIAEPGDFDSIEVVPWTPSIPDNKLEDIKIWIQKENPTIEEIEKRTSEYISQAEPKDYVRIPKNTGTKGVLPPF